MHLLGRIRDAAEANIASFRRCTGVQPLLDLLRIHVGSSDNGSLDATEQALVVEMCEPLITTVAEAGFDERKRAEERVAYDEAHPTRVALALMDEAGGGRPDVLPLLRCLHDDGCPAVVQVGLAGWIEFAGRRRSSVTIPAHTPSIPAVPLSVALSSYHAHEHAHPHRPRSCASF